MKKLAGKSLLGFALLCPVNGGAKIIDHTCVDKENLPCGYTSMRQTVRSGSCLVYPDGEIGGYVANSATVGSLDGGAMIPFVDRSSSVCGTASVNGHVRLLMGAKVYNSASVSGFGIEIYGGEIGGMAILSGRKIRVYPSAVVHGSAQVRGEGIEIEGHVHGPSEITGNQIFIEKTGNIHGNSRVSNQPGQGEIHIAGEIRGRSFVYQSVARNTIVDSAGARKKVQEGRDKNRIFSDSGDFSCLEEKRVPCGFSTVAEARTHGSCYSNPDGTLGGYLSDRAKVFQDAGGGVLYISPESAVCDSPKLSGAVSLHGASTVGGKAKLHGAVTLKDGRVYGKAVVQGKVTIDGVVHGLTRIGGFDLKISGHVHGHSAISGTRITVGRTGHIYGRSRIINDPGQDEVMVDGESYGRVTYSDSLPSEVIRGPAGDRKRSKKAVRESLRFIEKSF